MTDAAPSAAPALNAAPDRTSWVYWLLVALLATYIGLLTGFRAEHPWTDAWEHERSVKVMTETLWPPESLGNPTYAAPEASIRYSPYSLALAGVCRVTGMSPYTAMGIAGVVNTLLLGLAIPAFLGIFRCRAAAPSVLIVMVVLFGRPTEYANSLALSDLPWHQVNPSAFAYALALLAWALYDRLMVRGGAASMFTAAIACGLMGAVAILSHGMTGVFLMCGIAGIRLSQPRKPMPVELMVFVATSAVAFIACWLWPWYDFLEATMTEPNEWFWYIDGVLRKMVFVWGLPTLALAVVTLPWQGHPLVRFGHLALLGTLAAAAIAAARESALFMRLVFVGLTIVNVAIGFAAHQLGLFDPRTWPAWIGELRRGQWKGITAALLAMMLGYCLFFQAAAILREPYLARPLLAPIMGRENKQAMVRETYTRGLAEVALRDVVLADMETAWPVPSFSGRIVAALHLEFFVPDEEERRADVAAFEAAADLETIRRIVEKRDARWILLDDRRASWGRLSRLLPAGAVAAQERYLHLYDARQLGRPLPQAAD